MAFLDKARKMAERAQAEIGRAQQQFDRRGRRAQDGETPGDEPPSTPDPGVPHASGAAAPVPEPRAQAPAPGDDRAPAASPLGGEDRSPAA